jgi:uncharacterized protein YndB with AHSA1/START domain
MIHRYTVVRQTVVATTATECWERLTRPERVAGWFADVHGEIAPGRRFELHFGDGDFFRCEPVDFDPPRRLRFDWRFMGAGPRSAIEFALLETSPGHTEVSVIDRGEHTPLGAIEMNEGWADLLERLERAVRTGGNARYRWSETIGCAAVATGAVEEVRAALLQATAWRRFAGASVVPAAEGGAIRAAVEDPAWGGVSTAASIALDAAPDGARLTVQHSGWQALPEDRQVAERRRYAGYWAETLALWESLGRAEWRAAGAIEEVHFDG